MEEGHHSSYLIWAGRAANVNPTTTHHRKTLGSDFIPQGLNPSYDFSCSPLGHGAVSLKCRCNTELSSGTRPSSVSRRWPHCKENFVPSHTSRRQPTTSEPVSVSLCSPHVCAFLPCSVPIQEALRPRHPGQACSRLRPTWTNPASHKARKILHSQMG